MNPPSLVLAVDLGPDMVFAVPNPSDAGAHGPAEHGKTVGEFTSAASAGFEESPDVGVPGEPFISATVAILTSVEFNSGSTSSRLVGSGWCRATGHGWSITAAALWVVDKREEGALEPPQKHSDDAVLVTPFRLHVGTHRGSDALHDVMLLFGFLVDAIERHMGEGLVEKSRVLVLGGSDGHGDKEIPELVCGGI